MSHAAQSLDVAADTQEELSEWVAKIREATQNADARVRGPGVQPVGEGHPCPQGIDAGWWWTSYPVVGRGWMNDGGGHPHSLVDGPRYP